MTNWTLDTYIAHNEAIRKANEKLVEAKEKALREANRLLAVTIKYKHRQLNEWRGQLDKEREEFAKTITVQAIENKYDHNMVIMQERHEESMRNMQEKYDGLLKLVSEFIAARGGVEKGTDKTFYYIITIIITLSSIANILISILK